MPKGAIRFDVSIADPKKRLEAYLDIWRRATDFNVRILQTTAVTMVDTQGDDDTRASTPP